MARFRVQGDVGHVPCDLEAMPGGRRSVLVLVTLRSHRRRRATNKSTNRVFAPSGRNTRGILRLRPFGAPLRMTSSLRGSAQWRVKHCVTDAARPHPVIQREGRRPDAMHPRAKHTAVGSTTRGGIAPGAAAPLPCASRGDPSLRSG